MRKHRLKPTINHTKQLGNFIVPYKELIITIRDFQLNEETKDNGSESSLLIKEWFIDNDILKVKAEIVVTTNAKWIGLEINPEANKLCSRYNKWEINDIKPMPKTTLDELGYNVEDPYADLRSEFNAISTNHFLKSNEKELLMDGTGRNINYLLKEECSAEQNMIIDKDINVALYHKLLAIRLEQPFESKWTGELIRNNNGGIEECIKQNKLPNQDKISCAYFDFDCDIPKGFTSGLLLKKLPNLRLCGITQTKRGHKNKFPILGKVIRNFDQPRTWCRFMVIDHMIRDKKRKKYN